MREAQEVAPTLNEEEIGRVIANLSKVVRFLKRVKKDRQLAGHLQFGLQASRWN